MGLLRGSRGWGGGNDTPCPDSGGPASFEAAGERLQRRSEVLRVPARARSILRFRWRLRVGVSDQVPGVGGCSWASSVSGALELALAYFRASVSFSVK